MRDAWWNELERLRREQDQPAQIPLELPLHEPYEEPAETSPDPEIERGVVVIEF
jgi:hypothetical protein